MEENHIGRCVRNASVSFRICEYEGYNKMSRPPLSLSPNLWLALAHLYTPLVTDREHHVRFSSLFLPSGKRACHTRWRIARIHLELFTLFLDLLHSFFGLHSSGRFAVEFMRERSPSFFGCHFCISSAYSPVLVSGEDSLPRPNSS
jgi:hypothetical protein